MDEQEQQQDEPVERQMRPAGEWAVKNRIALHGLNSDLMAVYSEMVTGQELFSEDDFLRRMGQRSTDPSPEELRAASNEAFQTVLDCDHVVSVKLALVPMLQELVARPMRHGRNKEGPRHKPEHYTNGVNGMSLMDLIEMFADWKAQGDKRGGGIERALQVFGHVYHIEPQLQDILINTAVRLGWMKEPGHAARIADFGGSLRQ